ncbi:HvfX family Cu-binding RiPP maturation protein [Echinimonas agarilytica]|uniref:DoxX family protein n=1 Tax=Echinimonas agarilytica TaxID=1215918 RepID=A0AA41W712_9GAMM|nr:DoxX family protein [Echinimonas agarilytica]MCM2679969.1 DoxX family protein [Echinimonas agarilytica]
MLNLTEMYHGTIRHLTILDFLPLFFMRMILAPVMIVAGYNKLRISDAQAGIFEQLLPDPNVVSWFGNADWGLGLPFPEVLALMAGWTEFLGGWLILFGLLTRLASIPLMVTMLVAAFAVHWDNGWFAIAPSNGSTSAALVWSWLHLPGGSESIANSAEVGERLAKIKDIVAENGFPDYLYGRGSIAILNNGIEFAAIYFVMLLSLFFKGAGRFLSVDYWLTLKHNR